MEGADRVDIRNTWCQFWSGEQWRLFFLKFFVFSIAAFFVWSSFSIAYGRILSQWTIDNLRSSVPIMNVKFSDHRGLTVTLTMGPADKEVIPLEKPQITELDLFPNILHLNFVPFLALLFATPVTSIRRLVLFLLLGSLLLISSHYLHMYLNIRAFFYSQQTFAFNPASMTPEQLAAANNFVTKIRFLKLSQGFMEQAGSMIMPFLLWVLYAQRWLFRKISTGGHPKK